MRTSHCSPIDSHARLCIIGHTSWPRVLHASVEKLSKDTGAVSSPVLWVRNDGTGIMPFYSHRTRDGVRARARWHGAYGNRNDWKRTESRNVNIALYRWEVSGIMATSFCRVESGGRSAVWGSSGRLGVSEGPTVRLQSAFERRCFKAKTPADVFTDWRLTDQSIHCPNSARQ